LVLWAPMLQGLELPDNFLQRLVLEHKEIIWQQQ